MHHGLQQSSLCLLLALGAVTPVRAAVPARLTVHGLLSHHGQPLDGATEVTFRLYADLGDAVPFWDETLLVECAHGAFSVVLGLTTPIGISDLAAASAPALGLAVGGGPELEPRLAVTSVPYALASAQAERASLAEVAHALSCNSCVGTSTVAFSYAAGDGPGGAATGLACADACVQTTEIANGAVSESKLATGAVGSAALADGGIAAVDIGHNGCQVGDVLRWDGTGWVCGGTFAAAPYRQTLPAARSGLSGTVAILSQAVTMPAQGGPFRLLVSYGVRGDGGAGPLCSTWIEDTAASRWAVGTDYDGGGPFNLTVTDVSPVTYAPGTTTTVTLYGRGFASLAATDLAGASLNPTWLTVQVIRSP